MFIPVVCQIMNFVTPGLFFISGFPHVRCSRVSMQENMQSHKTIVALSKQMNIISYVEPMY